MDVPVKLTADQFAALSRLAVRVLKRADRLSDRFVARACRVLGQLEALAVMSTPGGTAVLGGPDEAVKAALDRLDRRVGRNLTAAERDEFGIAMTLGVWSIVLDSCI